MPIDKTMFEQAKDLAHTWQKEIETHREESEKKFHEIMGRMLKNPRNKVFLIELLDQSFRSHDPERVADQLEFIFEKYEGTEVFSHFEELLVWSFRHIGVYIPEISVDLFVRYLRNDVSKIVIKGEDELLAKHLQKRKAEGTRVNINIIGESVLGEEEAKSRIKKYTDALQNPNIDYISIKISTIFSQISSVAHEWSVDAISKRLDALYTTAIENSFVNAKGKKENKFVNLDMEEYRDINITVDAFIKTLSQEKFYGLRAGIVLQAYLPETVHNLNKLIKWAKDRANRGGVPIKIRLVKGANQEMELTEASLKNWECVTYLHKAQTDANYKLLMDTIIDKHVTPYVNVGIASHNLFDHALGLLLARERGVQEHYTAEMLEGMSETAYKVLKKEGVNVILYAPIATARTFTNAIAYLVRRFDENTAEQNFLRHSFGLKADSKAWKDLVDIYDESVKQLDVIPTEPFRTQNRNTEKFDNPPSPQGYEFKPESDTDFSLPQNIEWAEGIAQKWKNIHKNNGYNASIVIGGEEVTSEDIKDVIDKSQYPEKVAVGSYYKASKAQLLQAVEVAKDDPESWRSLSSKERQKILMNVANEFRKKRADFIGVAAAEVGKVFSETDVEVSEAIDFLNFYPYSVERFNALEGIRTKPKGVGVVVSPWNFPVAIPTGGVAASLAAGNTVILKPSSDAVLCAYMLCECFWNAGVSKNTLQFVPSSGSLAGENLIANEDVNFVILTGGESTALEMLKSRPNLRLSAETGGKDATIVTALGDKDQAVKNVVASAFNNSGQKCSATSLLVLEREVYEDENFKKMLIDAAASLQVGSVWELQNRVGTLVNKPTGNLQKALEYLDEGEEWALAPVYANDNPYMLKPSVRYGTKEGDFCHMHELFGPVLSVMCADSLEEAIDIVNSTGYGLTSGLESLDEREQKIFQERLRAGNLYINRVTTGAIVARQPFGGMGKSAVGSGKKAGGFNYVSQFMNIFYEDEHHDYLKRLEPLIKEQKGISASIEKMVRMAADFNYWYVNHFHKDYDHFGIRGENNIIHYIPVKSVAFRFYGDDTLFEMLSSITAAKTVGAAVHISVPKELCSEAMEYIAEKQDALLEEGDTFKQQDDEVFIDTMKGVERVRFLNAQNVPSVIYEAAAKDAVYIANDPFVAHGRIELMHYFIEQSISNSYHRYGNLGAHGLKQK